MTMIVALFFGIGLFCLFFFEIDIYGRKRISADVLEKLTNQDYENFMTLRFSNDALVNVDTVFVVPGGGSGSSGLPEWSKRRLDAANLAFKAASASGKRPIFILLSAGSLNSPNLLQEDGRMIFECQHMMRYLVDQLNVDAKYIFGDFISWDTVSNGLTLRMFIEGLLAIQSDPFLLEELAASHKKKKIQLQVYISDFHAERVRAVFEWVLSLQPSLANDVVLTIHSVGSEGSSSLTLQTIEDKIFVIPSLTTDPSDHPPKFSLTFDFPQASNGSQQKNSVTASSTRRRAWPPSMKMPKRSKR